MEGLRGLIVSYLGHAVVFLKRFLAREHRPVHQVHLRRRCRWLTLIQIDIGLYFRLHDHLLGLVHGDIWEIKIVELSPLLRRCKKHDLFNVDWRIFIVILFHQFIAINAKTTDCMLLWLRLGAIAIQVILEKRRINLHVVVESRLWWRSVLREL